MKFHIRRFLILIILLSCSKIATAQFSIKNWVAGSYYDLKGTKYAGLLTWMAPDLDAIALENIIYFKESTQSDEIKIPAEKIKGFVMNRFGNIDSFIISKNPLLERMPILEVLIHHNPIKLFRSITLEMSKVVKSPKDKAVPSSRSMRLTYYFGPNDQQLTLLDDHNFQTVMPKIMSDHPAVVSKITNNELAFKDMTMLLYVYRYNSLPPVSAPAALKKPKQ